MKPRMKSVALGQGVPASSVCADITAYPLKHCKQVELKQSLTKSVALYQDCKSHQLMHALIRFLIPR